MRNLRNQKRLFHICLAGLIAALYTVLTCLAGMVGLSGGTVQIRISEALCVLPFFTPAAIPGLTLGCFISNVITGCLWQDVLFGTLATLAGAVGARLLRKFPWLVPLPTVLANTLVIPPVLAFAYRVEEGLPFLFLSVGLGEGISAYLFGMFLLLSLRKTNVAEKWN